MSCERPYVLLALLFIIPAIFIIVFKVRNNNYTLEKNASLQKKFSGGGRLFEYKRMSSLRTILHGIAWCMLILAYSKISWGTHLVPVQKSGTSVSFVFDISNSMLAKDGPQRMTRLKASSNYAKKLLKNMEGIPVSVVLAKGDGINAIPMTEDYIMIESLLDVMSPSLMTSPGSSLGKGISKAKETFTSNYANAGRIWLFTDGEETDSYLKNALVDCVKSGIPVTIVGFGGEEEVDVLAGDGETYVKSALRSKKIKETIEAATKNVSFYKNQTQLMYIDSVEKGSAITLLNQVKKGDGQIVSYEAKPVPRYKMFLLLAVLFFAFSFIITEFDITKFIPDLQHVSVLIVFIGISVLFSGCSSDTMKILKGSYSFNQKLYGDSVSSYLEVVSDAKDREDTYILDFSLFDLGTAYAMLDEDDAAMEKYFQISDEAPDSVRYSAFYNAGVISYRNGQYDDATDFFKKALEIDSTKIEAKVNLEMSIQQAEVDVKNNQTQALPAQEEQSTMPDMEKAVFARIKENDQKQWKSGESSQNTNLAGDY